MSEPSVNKRGKLKIFFGFAPGVGKTYRMLQVARDLVIEKKLDVVVGIVEDHRRPETAQLMRGLDLLPRHEIEYRGRILHEFDLDAALARRPEVLLVDEIPHTNVPGSRHAKRWQDVDELLDAGIDVLTTMNVQHVESLNDVVAQILRIQVRETVPDSVLDHADAIELIDIAPEELLQRLKEGKVYLPDEARQAASHFFQRGNLLALRELALRRAAQHVDEDVREFREEHGVTSTWPASERIVVCVGPSPSSGSLVRAAARMAAGLRCPWVATYVEETTARAIGEPDRERLDAHLRLAETLGATIARLSGTSVAESVLQYARKHNVTRIIVGKPTHSRLRDRLRGSLLDEIVRGSGDIDVQVTSGDSGRDAPPVRDLQRPRAPVKHYLSAALLVVGTLLASLVIRTVLDLPDVEMLFLLAVMIAAVWFGRGPAIVASAIGVASYDFFFVPPIYRFAVEDSRYALTFIMLFVVGVVMSEFASRLRKQERDAVTREERTAALYELTRELASSDASASIAAIAARHAAGAFNARAVVFGVSDGGALHPIGSAPEGAQSDLKDLGVARWSFEHDELAGLGTDTLPGAKALAAPLHAGQSRLGVLALIPHGEAVLRGDQRALLDVFCRQTAAALERARLSAEAKQAEMRAHTEEMRSSLLSAVSHDLRTPLASITGAATTLRGKRNLADTTRGELVDSIVDEAARLERLVANLLDMTRLESGAIALKRDWVPLDEMISSSLTRLETRLEDRKVTVSIASDVPLVFVDPVLFEQIFVNLIENVVKYTPKQSPIEILARREGSLVAIELRDHGPGIEPGAELRIFEKFYRGPNVTLSGAGLGLPICKGIVEAHGGTIRAENRRDGATFRISIPSGGTPPSLGLEGAGA